MATVSTVSPEFIQQHLDIQLCRDLMGGTPAMIRAGEKYLPRGTGEDKRDWHERVNRTVLVNVFKRTIKYLRGQVFQKPVVLEQDASERFNIFSEDVDRQGHNLTVWSGGFLKPG